jgi:16S rRNA (guanine527-N7)-methyltransferase
MVPPSAQVTARLHVLAERYELPDAAVTQLAILLDALAGEHAPTTVHDPRKGVDIHVADSLSGLDVPQLRSARAIADIGAGAGLPGLVLATALPGARVTLVESAGRKCLFIAETAEAMGVEVEVVHARAEEWTGPTEIVTARALAPLAVLCEYAAPMLEVGGHLLAWKGAVVAGEREAAEAAAEQLGLRPAGDWPTDPYPAAKRHTLHLYSKVRETPDRFPRRPGMATKRPLGASSHRQVEG